MRKNLLAILMIAIVSISLTACGSNETNDVDTLVEQESRIQETEDPTEEIVEEPTEESTEFITSSEGTHIEGTNSEGLTVDEARAADQEYLASINYKNVDSWTAYAQSQGADAVRGAWWIYYYGGEISGNTERSYAINQRTGEKMIAGPNSFFYGTSMEDNGASPFWGSQNKIPGERYGEAETNHRRAIGEAEEYLVE